MVEQDTYRQSPFHYVLLKDVVEKRYFVYMGSNPVPGTIVRMAEWLSNG